MRFRRLKNVMELIALAGALTFTFAAQTNNASEPNEFPCKGETRVQELRWLDEQMKALVRRWGMPGASFAVVKDNRVLMARGYGFADVENRQPVEPEHSLFRIASISKSITALATLKLVEAGKLQLDNKVFDVLNVEVPATSIDRRLHEVTVRQLMDMTAGWDKERSGDPILQPYIRRAARRLHAPAPADFDTTMRYVLCKRLDFQPGSRFAYSNFTYGVLGKLIEHASKQNYESYVREALFTPCGVQLYRAHTREEDRLPNEVKYYAPLEPPARALLPGQRKKVPAPYGRAYLEADLPMIGWLATAPELATLCDRCLSDDQLINDRTRAQITTPPPCWHNKRTFFSMGWEVTTDRDGRPTFFKDGTLPGTRAFVQHTADGITWVALFNGRPPQKKSDAFATQLKEVVSQGLDLLPERRAQRTDRRSEGGTANRLLSPQSYYLLRSNFSLAYWRQVERSRRVDVSQRTPTPSSARQTMPSHNPILYRG